MIKITRRIGGLATGTALGVALAFGTINGLEAADAAHQDGPPCGYDVYKGKVYVTSLGKAKGTVRVIKWRNLGYEWQGEPVRQGTLVGKKRIKSGQTVTIKPTKRVKANRITVDIVKGKLSEHESRRKVWHCEPA